jgi:diguanylate cyclase (GGDEF)-like protein
MRILIAEDEAISRRMLEATLTKWGYDVVVTSNGDDALLVLRDQDAPLLAILDVMMPGMEGVEVCRIMRQLSQASPTYIILLTAKSSKAEIVKGLQAGADDYLTKPFDLDELYARVQVGMRVVQLQRSLTGRVRQLEVAEAELRSLSLTDDLTGLCNRRGFFVHAEQYLKTSRRLRGKQFLLFYADMDGLKQINDAFGHEEGSLAIRRLAEILKDTFREADIVARLGGDEFAMLVTDVALSHKESISYRLQENLRNHNTRSLSDYDLSLSLGIVYVDLDDNPATVDELIAQADQQMYNHKREKRQATLANDTESRNTDPSETKESIILPILLEIRGPLCGNHPPPGHQ